VRNKWKKKGKTGSYLNRHFDRQDELEKSTKDKGEVEDGFFTSKKRDGALYED